MKKGMVGKSGSDYIVNFSIPGVDFDAALPSQMVFREDVEEIKPLVSGTVTLANNATATVPLPKTFVLFPLVFVGAILSSTSVSTMDRRTLARVRAGVNYFTLQNKSGSTRELYYRVFDNEVGQEVYEYRGRIKRARPWSFPVSILEP